jgi:hypothetical protein
MALSPPLPLFLLELLHGSAPSPSPFSSDTKNYIFKKKRKEKREGGAYLSHGCVPSPSMWATPLSSMKRKLLVSEASGGMGKEQIHMTD